MSLADYMSKDLITVCLDDDLKKVKTIFEGHNLHHILVIDDDGKLYGVITDRDLYKHLSPAVGTAKETQKDAQLLNKKVNLIMSHEVHTAKADLSVSEAIVLFNDHQLSCLPVVNDDNKPVGIITWRDIIKLLALQYQQKLAKS
ncbi:MAG: CBS domain-containing protein [Thalassotalea sp.]